MQKQKPFIIILGFLDLSNKSPQIKRKTKNPKM